MINKLLALIGLTRIKEENFEIYISENHIHDYTIIRKCCYDDADITRILKRILKKELVDKIIDDLMDIKVFLASGLKLNLGLLMIF